MAEMTPQRRKVVVLAACVAIFSATIPTIMQRHPKVGVGLLCVEVILLVYVIAQFAMVMRAKR